MPFRLELQKFIVRKYKKTFIDVFVLFVFSWGEAKKYVLLENNNMISTFSFVFLHLLCSHVLKSKFVYPLYINNVW